MEQNRNSNSEILLPQETRLYLSKLKPKPVSYEKWSFFDNEKEVISVEGKYLDVLHFIESSGLAPAKPIYHTTWMFIDETGKESRNQKALKAIILSDYDEFLDMHHVRHSAIEFITDQQFLKHVVCTSKDDYLAECAVGAIRSKTVLQEILLSEELPERSATMKALEQLKGDDEFLYQYAQNKSNPFCEKAKEYITDLTLLWDDDFLIFNDYNSLEPLIKEKIYTFLWNKKEVHKKAGNLIEAFFYGMYIYAPSFCRTQLNLLESMRKKGENPDNYYLSDTIDVFWLREDSITEYGELESEKRVEGYMVLYKNIKEVLRISEWGYREDMYDMSGSTYSNTKYSDFILKMGNCLCLYSSIASSYHAWYDSNNYSYFSSDGGDTWREGVIVEKLLAEDCSPKLIRIK